jgi:hypothetical protein
MIDLSDVTLVAFDNTPKVEETIKALYTSMGGIKYGSVKLITSEEHIANYKFKLESEGIQLEESVIKVNNYNDYNYYVIYKLNEHIKTSHCLLIQSDGFVIFPEKWDNSWLEYDYIGAPWELSENAYIDPWGSHHRVGNGGFSLRSKKLLEIPNKVEIPWETNNSDFYWMPPGVVNYHEDGNICVHNRHIYIENGCKFAPVKVAVKFSQEARISECDGIVPFGFHYNLPPGVILQQ